VLLQEATVPAVVERLATATGLSAWGARPGVSVAFLSRDEVAGSEWHLPRPANRPFLELAVAGSELRLFGVHLTAVHSNWTERRRVRELRGLLAAVARHQNGFHVIAGDFNTLAPGEQLDVRSLPYRLRAFIWLTGRTIRWQTIQLMLDGGYVDCHRRLHPDDPGFTFPTWSPHVRLDYAFLPATFADRIRDFKIVSDPANAVAAGSDHFPVLIDIDIAS
jgi:exodeoxyribonuclease-3